MKSPGGQVKEFGLYSKGSKETAKQESNMIGALLWEDETDIGVQRK